MSLLKIFTVPPGRRLWIIAFVAIMLLTLAKAALVIAIIPSTDAARPSIKSGTLYKHGGDTGSFLSPHENLIQSGEYYWLNQVGDTTRAGRVPYYGAPYFVARTAGASARMAFEWQGVFQLLLFGIATFLVLRMCVELSTTKGVAFYLGLLLLSLEFAGPYWNCTLLSDGPAASYLLIGIYCLTRQKLQPRGFQVLLGGAMLAMGVLLRPFLAPVPLVAGLLLVVSHIRLQTVMSDPKSASWPTLIKNLVLLGLPLLLLLTPWVIRNYSIFNRFVPLQENTVAGYAYSDAEMGYRKFATSTGGSLVFWNPEAMSCYFQPKHNNPCNYTVEDIPDRVIKATGFSRKQFAQLRERFVYAERHLSWADSTGESQAIGKTFKALAERYRNEKTIDYYLGVPLRVMRQMVIHSGSYYLPQPQSGIAHYLSLLIRLGQSALYYATLLLGTAGLFWLVLRKRRPTALLLLMYPISICFILAYIFHGQNEQYFIMSSVFLTPGLVYLLSKPLQNRI